MQKTAQAMVNDDAKNTLDIIALWVGKFVGIFAAIASLYKGVQIAYRKVRTIVRKIDGWLDSTNAADGKISRISEIVERNEMRWLALQSRLTIAVFECDSEGNCTFANPAICELFNLSREQMLGNGWLNKVGRTPEQREHIWHDWQQSIKNNIPYEAYYEIRKASGEYITCRATAMAYRDSSGKVLFFSGTVEKLG
jgi:PAS domain S-box-containing protein